MVITGVERLIGGEILGTVLVGVPTGGDEFAGSSLMMITNKFRCVSFELTSLNFDFEVSNMLNPTTPVFNIDASQRRRIRIGYQSGPLRLKFGEDRSALILVADCKESECENA